MCEKIYKLSNNHYCTMCTRNDRRLKTEEQDLVDKDKHHDGQQSFA